MSSATLVHWGDPAAIIGGLLWMPFVTALTFTHGSTEDPRGTVLAGLTALGLNRLLALPPLLWIVGLVGTATSRRGRT